MQRIVQQFTPLSWTEYGTAPSTFQRLLERRKAIHVGLCQSYNITYNKQCVTSRRVGRLAFTTPAGGRAVATDCVDGCKCEFFHDKGESKFRYDSARSDSLD